MNTVLSILVLAAIALLGGAAWLWNRARKQAPRKSAPLTAIGGGFVKIRLVAD